ncbi:hypothetical protein B0H16DRAFT_1465449 [Mycena metata]|uniref:Uncharacterized protein n=1 Tax=Mycena metata TaxID=1033252 RepID=A0AAD7IB80_9AGAR|nr:hypothetical protein B0H16DRAFT_1465449 [Mycena metata]
MVETKDETKKNLYNDLEKVIHYLPDNTSMKMTLLTWDDSAKLWPTKSTGQQIGHGIARTLDYVGRVALAFSVDKPMTSWQIWDDDDRRKVLRRIKGMGWDDNFQVDVTGEVSGVAVAAWDPDHKEKVIDAAVLTLHLQVIPKNGAAKHGIDRYIIELKCVDAATAKQHENDNLDQNLTALGQVTFCDSSPTESTTSETHSVSSSISLGVDVGFFGATPTGTATSSYSLSTSDSWTQPNIRCADYSDRNTVKKVFEVSGESQKHTLNFKLSTALHAPHETFGSNRTLENGDKIAFELGIRAEKTITAHTISDWGLSSAGDIGDTTENLPFTKTMATQARQIIWLNAPPESTAMIAKKVEKSLSHA